VYAGNNVYSGVPALISDVETHRVGQGVRPENVRSEQKMVDQRRWRL